MYSLDFMKNTALFFTIQILYWIQDIVMVPLFSFEMACNKQQETDTNT